jgi:hypothetical protein
MSLEALANKYLDDSIRKEKLLAKVYFAIKRDDLMQNLADAPEVRELVEEIGKEIGVDNVRT